MKRLAARVWLSGAFLRFLIVGALNTALAYAVYALLLWLGLAYGWANLGSLVVGILVSFFLQGRLVFGSHDNRLLPRFVLCWLILYALNVALIAGLMRLGLNAYTAGALALLPMALGSFLVQRTFVFGGSRRPVQTESHHRN
ncbi:GtrA family protein [Roseateles puraquae]|uniref:GtrA family protein n=1 Tax=Roseateles puraquae TaxID=431059 RepID=UPI0031D08C6B